MPLRQIPNQQSPWSWTGLTALLLAANIVYGAGASADACDFYNVELQASFPNQIATPCTDEEHTIISALLHSLVQTDAIIGMNSMQPVPPFFLAFETYGLGAARLSSFEEHDFTTTQLQMALPHYSIEDELEDLFYAYDSVANRFEPDNSTDALQKDVNNAKGSTGDEGSSGKTLVTPYENDFEAIQPFEDSLRTVTDAVDETNDNKYTTEDSKEEPAQAPFNVTEVYDGEDCEADWCGHFFSKPCGSISHNSLEDMSPQYQAKLESFQDRVGTIIEHKLRKWARDSDCMCLGNSWELRAIVRKIA